MIICPVCGGESEVVNSRRVGTAQRRRRKCTKCGERWSTYEVSAAFVQGSSEIAKVAATAAATLTAAADYVNQAAEDYELDRFLTPDGLPKVGDK